MIFPVLFICFWGDARMNHANHLSKQSPFQHLFQTFHVKYIIILYQCSPPLYLSVGMVRASNFWRYIASILPMLCKGHLAMTMMWLHMTPCTRSRTGTLPGKVFSSRAHCALLRRLIRWQRRRVSMRRASVPWKKGSPPTSSADRPLF